MEFFFFKRKYSPTPAATAANANKMVVGEKVDVLVGTVHSGVAAAMVQVAREENATLIIPNAGVGLYFLLKKNNSNSPG